MSNADASAILVLHHNKRRWKLETRLHDAAVLAGAGCCDLLRPAEREAPVPAARSSTGGLRFTLDAEESIPSFDPAWVAAVRWPSRGGRVSLRIA
jgi:hypothetical protein